MQLYPRRYFKISRRQCRCRADVRAIKEATEIIGGMLFIGLAIIAGLIVWAIFHK